MNADGYKWQVVTDEGCFTRASNRGIDIFEAVREGHARKLVFFCERSSLPIVGFRVRDGMELIFCRVRMRDESVKEPPYLKKHFQMIGYRENGRTVLNEIDLDTGAVGLV